MDVKSRILESLVRSAAAEQPQVALDLTRQGIAARTLAGVGVRFRRTPAKGERYDLVVCPMSELPRALSCVEIDGSIIVHIRNGQHGDLLGLAGAFGLVASARTPTGAWLRLRRMGDAGRVAPRASVIMPVRNEAAAVAQLLSTLADQPTDPAWELVVVDRGSSDATADLLERVTGNLRRIRVPRETDPVDALYAGTRAAQGDVIVPTPPGLVPGCGFVSALMRHVDLHPPSARPLLGGIVAQDGRAVPGALARAFNRSATPTTARRLAKWLQRRDGVQVPGFRMRQLTSGRVPSIGSPAESFDGAAKAEADAILAQSR